MAEDKPRYSRVSDILDLAVFMSSKIQGVTIKEISERYNVSRRTAERMRDSLTCIFPSIDEIETDDAQKHWGFTNYSISNLITFTPKEMRLIAVGDDDQNIYEFRGSNSKYLQEMISKYGAYKYEMTMNYRSCENIVLFANAFVQTIQNRIKQSEGITNKKGGGVDLIEYETSNIEVPMVQKIIEEDLHGSTCILTKTNDEALKILGVFNEKKIPAKLIQSLDGFSLLSLQEIRFIMWFLNKNNNPFQISDQLWKSIKFHLQRIFKTSNCLQLVLKMLNDFEQTNPAKYFSDLENFFDEAKIEDFYEREKGIITISTIHKAKGHEYDNVYMLMNNNSILSDENKRKIYVGITRAKSNLFIHYNDNIFKEFVDLPGIKKDIDIKEYAPPHHVILQLSHKDVYLDYFKYRQKEIVKLRSGDSLNIQKEGLSAKIKDKEIDVLKFSAACKEKIKSLLHQGYQVSEASVRFIVYWQKQEEERDVAIILPDIKFIKK